MLKLYRTSLKTCLSTEPKPRGWTIATSLVFLIRATLRSRQPRELSLRSKGKFSVTFGIFLLSLLFFGPPLIADTPTPSVAPPVETPLPATPVPLETAVPEVSIPGYEGAFFKMFLTLIALVVAIFFTVWALKRLSQGRLHQMNSNRSIKILERRPLSPKTVLYLVEVAGKQAVIAESQLEVKRILSFEDFTEQEKTE